jgi:hypothetical protein
MQIRIQKAKIGILQIYNTISLPINVFLNNVNELSTHLKCYFCILSFLRMRASFSLSVIFLILFQHGLNAQYYDTGTDPASISWFQIKTDNFRVVFPSLYRAEAVNSARLLEEAYSRLSDYYPVGKRNYRTNVIIHNYSHESNGYVAWAPRRMELFPTPSQNSIPQSHSRQLAFHETVHILQMKSLERGLSGFLSRLGGQQVTGGVASLLPNWFLEGDAVYFETLANTGGRGEVPRFNKELKALFGSKPSGYSYDKLLLGSYRNYTPDHYQFGFRMVEYSRAKYGDDLWKNAVKFTAGFPFTINPVNLSLRSESGLTKKKLYSETFDNLKILWQNEQLANPSLNYEAVSPDKRNRYINYHSPVVIGKDSIAAIKTSLYETLSIVLITNNTKSIRKLIIPGSIYPWLLNSGGGKLTWAENTPDPRWENRNFSNVVVYEIATGKVKRLTSQSRLTAPALSPDGKLIAASENSPKNTNSIVIIDAVSGEIIRRAETPSNGFPQRPVWSEDGSSISVIMLTERGEGISAYSVDTDIWTSILEPEATDLHDAMIRNDTLFFVSAKSGTDNIYYRTPGDSVYRITRSNYGVSNFSLAGSRLFFSDYTMLGNYIGTTSITGEIFNYASTEKTSAMVSLMPSQITAAAEEPAENDGVNDLYPIKRFRKLGNILNIHSWMPFYASIDELSTNPSAITPGVTLFSQNLLSSLVGSLGYEYNGRNHLIHSGFIWKGWYPVIDFKTSYGGEAAIFNGNNSDAVPSVINPSFDTKTTLYLPLKFTTGRYTQFLRPSIDHQYYNNYIYNQSDGLFDYGQHYLSGRLYFSNIRRSSLRDIYPAFAQVFDINYTTSPFDEELYGAIATIRTALYFPGLLRNHGLRIRYEKEKQEIVKFVHLNRAIFARGYYDIISEKLETISADYVFPLLYPDLAAGSLFYLKRIRGSLFYDYSTGYNNIYETEFVRGYQHFSSFGGELLADFNILRIPFEITAGARAGYIPGLAQYFTEAVFHIDVYGFKLGR